MKKSNMVISHAGEVFEVISRKDRRQIACILARSLENSSSEDSRRCHTALCMEAMKTHLEDASRDGEEPVICRSELDLGGE